MIFPEDVKDKKAYIKYKKLERHELLNEKKFFESSDGSTINIGWLTHFLKKKIEHLPKDEIEEILSKKDIYSKVNNNATVQKRKAYGFTQGRAKKGEKSSSLLELRRPEIIEYFGRMFTAKEVLKMINTDWGIKFNSLPKLGEFRKKYAKEIQERVEVFKASHSDIRLGVKRSRLEELTYMFGQQKDKWKERGSNESYKLLLQTIESIRKEAEGDRLTIDGKIDISYEGDIQKHLREEVFKTLNLKEVILGRVAARMNIDPIRLIHSLNNSFYSKFSNVLGDFDPEEAANANLIYPSQMNYDFERIGKAQRLIIRDVEEAVVVEEAKRPPKDLDKAQDIRRELLSRLKKKKAKISITNTNVDAITKHRDEK